MNSNPSLSRSKSISKAFKRAKKWWDESSTLSPLTLASTSDNPIESQPGSRLTRSSTTISRNRKTEQLIRPRNRLRSISSQANCHLLYSENLQDVVPITSTTTNTNTNGIGCENEQNPTWKEERAIKSLGDLSNLRQSFDDLYQQVEGGNRRISFIFVSDDDENRVVHSRSSSMNQIKRKPVALQLEQENPAVQADNVSLSSLYNSSPPSKNASIKRIPRKAVPKYLEEVESPPATSNSTLGFNTSTELTKTPELRPSSRGSISSLESFSSSKSSFFQHEQGQCSNSSSNQSPLPSPHQFSRPQRSPSRLLKNQNANSSIKIQTHDLVMNSVASSIKDQSLLSPIEPSPMEEVKTPEGEFKSGKDLVRLKKRQGILF